MGRTTYRLSGETRVTAEREARRWLRQAKATGLVDVLGGGWWRIRGWNRPVQGFRGLAVALVRRGVLNLDGSRREEG